MKVREKRSKKIALFGHFDSSNFGNESTLQAMLYHLRRLRPDAEITCISTGPEATAATHHVNAIPIADVLFDSWIPRNRVSRVLRRICIGLPSEFYRWIRCFITLSRTDVLIVPGTGLLTDAYGVLNWGPYNLFKWSLMARVCRCKLRFVSIGAGPIYGELGKYCVRSMLSYADFRSYRDSSSKRYLKEIGFRADGDREYPDLAFSLPEAVIPRRAAKSNQRPIVGVGVMAHAGKYSTSGNEAHQAYLESLVQFVRWLLAHDYDVRLLIGDVADRRVTQEFRSLLRDRLSLHESDETRIVDEPVNSVEDLLSQIAATEMVVATRFHNTLFAMLCDKPVIAISFHHKCESLMSAMGLSDYCLNIDSLKPDGLIEKFCNLKANANKISLLIGEGHRKFRKELDEQYKLIFSDI